MPTLQTTNTKPKACHTLHSPSPGTQTRKNRRPVSQNNTPSPRPTHNTPPAGHTRNPPSPPSPNPEKRNPVNQNQKTADRLKHVQRFVQANPQIFARQGTVATTWRTYKGKRLGPYYQLTYRDQDRQHWLYLGRSEQLAHQVRELLDDIHRPRDQRRLYRRLQSQARASLRLAKAHLKELLAPRGITLKGWEFRGVRKFLAQYAGPRHSSPPRPIRPAPT